MGNIKQICSSLITDLIDSVSGFISVNKKMTYPDGLDFSDDNDIPSKAYVLSLISNNAR